MSKKDPYPGRPTRALPRAELAPISSRALGPDDETRVECPLCRGVGMVSPETRAAHMSGGPKPPPEAA